MPRVSRTTAALASAAAAAVTAGLLVSPPATSAPGGAGQRCTIVGTQGDDRLLGTSKNDVICGMGGNDFIRVRGGTDIVYAGPGDDYVVIESGRGKVYGGPGDDEIVGGRLRDELHGGAGNDLVVADGGRRDVVRGGGGADVCVADRRDRVRGCRLDRRAPVVRSATWTQSSLDVTDGSRSTELKIRVTDDAAVATVWVDLLPRRGTGSPKLPAGIARLTSGTARNGVWTFRVKVPDWAGPGTYDVEVLAQDRVWLKERSTTVRYDNRPLQVTNETPDVENPMVEMLRPAADAVYDARRDHVSVPVRVRVRDSGSGVRGGGVSAFTVEPRREGGDTHMRGNALRRVSGTPYDGIWAGSLYVPRGSLGGTWPIVVTAQDRASEGTGEMSRWTTEEERPFHHGDVRVLPGGRGSVEVIGRTRSDDTPPRPTRVTIDSTEVDAGREHVVRVEAGVVDVGSGVESVYAALVPADGSTWGGARTRLYKISGTIRDGGWRGDIVLPPDTAPGTYWLHLVTEDRDRNQRTWVPQNSPHHPDQGTPYAGLPHVVVRSPG